MWNLWWFQVYPWSSSKLATWTGLPNHAQYLKIWLNNNSTVSKTEENAGNGTWWGEKCSTMTRITVLFCERGGSVMKSRAKWHYGLWRTGRGMSLPAGRVYGAFARAHEVHDEINLLMSDTILGHQYLCWRSWYVLWTLEWPKVREVWAHTQLVSEAWWHISLVCTA